MSQPMPPSAPATQPDELSQGTQDFLSALASPTRQAIVMLFARGAQLSVGEVAQRAGIGQSTASEQLKSLRRARIVEARRDGRTILYSADRAGMTKALGELQSYLEACC